MESRFAPDRRQASSAVHVLRENAADELSRDRGNTRRHSV